MARFGRTLKQQSKISKAKQISNKNTLMFHRIADSSSIYLLCGLLSLTRLTCLSAVWISFSFLFSFATNAGRTRRQGDLGFLPPPSDAVIWKCFTDFLALCQGRGQIQQQEEVGPE